MIRSSLHQIACPLFPTTGSGGGGGGVGGDGGSGIVIVRYIPRPTGTVIMIR